MLCVGEKIQMSTSMRENTRTESSIIPGPTREIKTTLGVIHTKTVITRKTRNKLSETSTRDHSLPIAIMINTILIVSITLIYRKVPIFTLGVTSQVLYLLRNLRQLLKDSHSLSAMRRKEC